MLQRPQKSRVNVFCLAESQKGRNISEILQFWKSDSIPFLSHFVTSCHIESLTGCVKASQAAHGPFSQFSQFSLNSISVVSCSEHSHPHRLFRISEDNVLRNQSDQGKKKAKRQNRQWRNSKKWQEMARYSKVWQYGKHIHGTSWPFMACFFHMWSATIHVFSMFHISFTSTKTPSSHWRRISWNDENATTWETNLSLISVISSVTSHRLYTCTNFFAH